MNVTFGSGYPGASATINIRGVNSISGNASPVSYTHLISISGYHMQEAGATADIELAYTLAVSYTHLLLLPY